MEVKCENCKYAVSNSGRPCREIVGRCSEYKEFVSVEEKPMEQKKYRLKKDLPDCKAGAIFELYENHAGYMKYFSNSNYYDENRGRLRCNYETKVVESNPDWFEEVGTDMLESIIDENFIGDEIKKNLKQCIIKQKIELLYAIRSKDEPIGIAIDDKISELEKEIK